MAVAGDKQMKKARAAVNLSRAGNGDIGDFDGAVAQLDATETGMALVEAGHQLRQVDEQRAELNVVAQALAELELATGYRAVVLEVSANNGSSVAPAPAVYLGMLGQPQQLVAGLLPGLKPEDLEPGDEVEVVRCGSDQFAVRRKLGRHRRFGAVGRLDQITPEGLVRVTMGAESLYLKPSKELAREIESCADETELLGCYVSFDSQNGMAFGFFGDPERKELVLRETPELARDELIVQPSVATVLDEEVLLPLQHAELAKAYDIKPVSFLCFTGPPGVGKTHAARWIASELNRPVYLISGAELSDMWYGGTEAKLSARLEAAANEPNGAVVVWDEAESMLVERGTSAVGVENRVVSLMLSFTDGFKSNAGVLIVLTTNRADLIDRALLRSLRATQVAFLRPDATRTRQLFELYLGNMPCKDCDTAQLAREATRAVFANREAMLQLVLRDSSRVPVMRSAAVSGALVRAATERAKRLAFVRHARAGGRGKPKEILRADLFVALDEQFSGAAQELNADNVASVVTIPREATGNIVAVEVSSRLEPHRYSLDPSPAGPGRANGRARSADPQTAPPPA